MESTAHLASVLVWLSWILSFIVSIPAMGLHLNWAQARMPRMYLGIASMLWFAAVSCAAWRISLGGDAGISFLLGATAFAMGVYLGAAAAWKST